MTAFTEIASPVGPPQRLCLPRFKDSPARGPAASASSTSAPSGTVPTAPDTLTRCKVVLGSTMQSAYRRTIRSSAPTPQANATRGQTVIASAVHQRCTAICPECPATETHQGRPTSPNASDVATAANSGPTRNPQDPYSQSWRQIGSSCGTRHWTGLRPGTLP